MQHERMGQIWPEVTCEYERWTIKIPYETTTILEETVIVRLINDIPCSICLFAPSPYVFRAFESRAPSVLGKE